MREDIPEWLGKPPLRGTHQWAQWLVKWRQYAKQELRDTAADDPDFDFGLLSMDERWRVALQLQIRAQIAHGRLNGRVSLPSTKRTTDLEHAGAVAWQVGRSVVQPIPDAQFNHALEWTNARENPRRRSISHGIRYGFLAGLGGEPSAPAWSTPDYVAAYEAAWEIGNSIAIDGDPRG